MKEMKAMKEMKERKSVTMSEANPLPQDELKTVVDQFGKKLGIPLVVDAQQYCAIGNGPEMVVHLKYNVHFQAIFFYTEIGIIPPSYEKEVLFYYLCLNGSASSDCFTFSYNQQSGRLGCALMLPSGFITLSNFEMLWSKIIARYEIERDHLLIFGEGRHPTSTDPISRTISLPPEEARTQLNIYHTYLQQVVQILGILHLIVDRTHTCSFIFNEILVVKISFLPNENQIKLFCSVNPISHKTVGCYAAMLDGCYFWRETAGSNLSIDPENDRILICWFLNMNFLNSNLFYKSFEKFINTINYWYKKSNTDFKSISPTLPQRIRDIDRRTDKPKDISNFVIDFSEFREIQILGRGQFGVITLVENPSNHELLLLENFDEETDSTQLINQVKILNEARHPSIVEIIGFSPGVSGKVSQLATKYSGKGSLRELMDIIITGKAPDWLDWTQVAKIFCGIVLGMRFVHSRGIIHRDLRPENIFLDDEGLVKIGNFGKSTFPDLIIPYENEVNIETARYVAPELFDRQYSPAVDVYSFSVIVYEFFKGERIFSNDIELNELIDQVKTGMRPDIPDFMNPILKNIVSRGWAVDPNVRPTFDEILKELKNIQFKIVPGVLWPILADLIEKIEYGDQQE
jgi:hypothetical protein